jgi:hypothetical protein
MRKKYQNISVMDPNPAINCVVDPQWFQRGSGSSILGQCKSGSTLIVEKEQIFSSNDFYSYASMQCFLTTGKASCPAKRISNTSFKILNFFLFWWVIFAVLDPDPHPYLLNPNQSGSWSKTVQPALQIIENPCGSGSTLVITKWEGRIKKNFQDLRKGWWRQ